MRHLEAHKPKPFEHNEETIMHTNEAEPVDGARSTYAAAEALTLPAEYEEVEESFAEFIRAKCLDDYVSDPTPH
ncbi:MAG: hypothetical protein K0Q83_2925 [Deltaproteobacteria bacterium]|jgi:hypothetical protein|nr:hypothetical protein [Deltaproteobacteria bacterium]